MTINRRSLLAGGGAAATAAALPVSAEAAPTSPAPVFGRREDLVIWQELDRLTASAERMRNSLRLAAAATHPIERSGHLLEMRCSMIAMRLISDFVAMAADEQISIHGETVERFKAAQT